jgi:lysophospholipase L1-like esterase
MQLTVLCIMCALTTFGMLCCGSSGAGADEVEVSQTVIMEMDAVHHTPGVFGENETPVGSVELVDGKFGKACRFNFVANSQNAFFQAPVKATAEWDRAAGISFWVKGDGSDSWGALQLIDATDFRLRYGYWFPIDSTEWTKVEIPWCDLIPELPVWEFVDPKTGYRPSGFGHLWFGKRIRWWEFPAHSYAIDRIALESSIPVDGTDYTPPTGGVPRFLAKLKAKQPVTILTMGDSLSDKHHWANRDLLWSELVVENLKEAYGCEATLVNPAVGGSQLTHGLIHMARWLRTTPEPDVVTVWFGGNDWEDGMRGEHYQEVLRFAVDRIRRLTKGKSEILLITPIPSIERWDDMEEMAEAARVVAREKKTGLADVSYVFHEIGIYTDRKPQLYAWDEVHLGGFGHHVVADTVFRALTARQ